MMGTEKTFIFLIFLIGMVTAQSNNECKTPDNKVGECVDIYDCPMLLYQLNDTDTNLTAKNFLKESFCGFDEKKNVKVCCSSEGDTIPPQTNCGKSAVYTTHIIGGRPATLGAWPWIAALGYTVRGFNDKQWNCGGTLISKRHVLTAAHCVYDLNPKQQNLSVVRLGELDLDPKVNDGASPIDYPIQKYFVHEAYNTYNIISDIALVKLAQAVNYNDFILPVKLPNIRNAAEDLNHMAFVAGWGNTNNMHIDDFPNKNTHLMDVEIPLVSTDECKKVYSSPRTRIDHRVICAGAKQGGIDSCLGDSGGPLMLLRDDQYILIGIVSFGHKECGTPGIPSVYTSVAAHMQWIVNQTKK